jgi:VanZ family protein
LGIAAIVVLSLLPQEAAPRIGLWDKLQHFLAYGLVASVGAIGFAGTTRHILVAVGLVILGCLLEACQWFIPGREAALGDAFANAVGVLAGVMVMHWSIRLQQRWAWQRGHAGSRREGS